MATTSRTKKRRRVCRKLEIITAGLPGEYSSLLLDRIPREDTLTVMDYMIENYRRDIIKCLTKFIVFCHQARRLKAKKLKQLDREDIGISG